MANIRIIHDNAAERATITATSTAAGSLAASTLNTNTKSLAHRSGGTSAGVLSVTYTLTWATAEQINGIILPATNLSSNASIVVYTNGNSQGSKTACPNTTLNNYSGIKNVNSFPYGGLSKTAFWLNSTVSCTTMTISLIDTGKTSVATVGSAYPDYIDCSRIICGKYWEPSIGVDKNGLELTVSDTTQTSRSDSGDLISDRGNIYDQLNFNLSILTKSDKEQLISILKNVGSYKNIALSIIPDNNSRDEQDYLIYGKKEVSSIGYLVHNYYSHSFSITGW